MKKSDVEIGATYLVKVGSNLVPVRITREHDAGGWEGTSDKTGKTIRIKSPQRLRKRVTAPEEAKAVHAADQQNARLRDERAASEDGMAASERAMADSATQAEKPAKATKDAKAEPQRDTGERAATGGQRLSLIDAAAQVLADAKQPLSTREMVERVTERGLWTPGAGKTPANTLYSAILREIKVKGDDARFTKVERGRFELAKKGA